MMKQFWLSLLACQLSAFCLSAQVNIDSLVNVANTSPEDTSKVLTLLKIADAYETNHQDSAWYYLEKTKTLAEKLDYVRGIYKYHEQSLIVAFTVGNYTLASEHGTSALELASQLQDTS